MPKIEVHVADPFQTQVDVLAIGVHEDDSNPSSLAPLHTALGSGLKSHLSKAEFKGKRDQRIVISTLGKLPAAHVVLIGLGKSDTQSDASLRTFAALASKTALAEHAESLAIVVPTGASDTDVRYVAEGAQLGAYRFTKYFTGDRKPKKELDSIIILGGGKKKVSGKAEEAAEIGSRIGMAISLTRDLQNEPPNELTPEALADAAVKVAKDNGMKVTVWDVDRLEKDGMKLILAVGQGSVNKPRMVHMIYTPEKKAKRKLVFVGKGLTFDSGGLCIKPAQGMGEMKTDMSGAANVIGLMAAVAALEPRVEVHGIIGCAENMPDGEAYRPGDIFGSLDGKTVEIINTDAEGRLVLADCLAYAATLEPNVIIDNATLTGACVVALGASCSGFFATNDDLGNGFDRAAKSAGEQFWRLPLLEDLKDQLKSDVADLKHTGDRMGGAITAALFLREFVGKTPWIHCDIAGPSMASRPHGIYPKGGTGHGVLTFLEYIENGF